MALCLAFSFSFPIFADESQPDGQGMAPVDGTDIPDAVVAVDSMSIAEPLVRTDMAADSTLVAAADSVPSPIGVKRIFNPDPNRALWLSVLCPGWADLQPPLLESADSGGWIRRSGIRHILEQQDAL